MSELPPNIQTPDSLRKIENLKIKILIADDEKYFQDLYLEILSGMMGYTVEVVKSGEALLEKLANNSYNLVITDNNMGGISGLEVLKQIRANEKLKNLPKLPVIVCSLGEIKRSVVEENNAVFLLKSATFLDDIQKTVETVLATERDQKIRDKILALYKSSSFEKVHADIVKRAKYLEGKYDDIRNYAVFHAFVGSSIRGVHPDLVENDLPGKDSIEKFVEDLYIKYKK